MLSLKINTRTLAQLRKSMFRNIIVFLGLPFLLTNSALSHGDGSSHEHSSQSEASHKDHAHHHSASASTPTLQMSVKVEQPLEKGKEVLTTLTISSKKDGSPISPAELKEVHTAKVHLLIFDQTLNDYQHIHPTPSSKSGQYTFTWTPKKDGVYRVWADLIPLATNNQEYVVGDIPAKINTTFPVEKTISVKETKDDLTYTLTFDKSSLKVGESLTGEINIADKDGKPFQGLEPIMGTFAHIVAVSEDLQTIEHIHPLGAENPKPTEKGGPKLQFHLTPSKAGYLKFYVQVQVNGKQLFIPFGIQVNS